MEGKEVYMMRCMQLAVMGQASVAPNPMVGCVIVKDGVIIGEGYHRQAGQAHAEINAIQSVADREKLRGAELYVNLEPCCHYGKTPPCSESIISAGLSAVYIAAEDANGIVSGMGIRRLEEAGLRVETGILRREELFLNRRFRTFHQKSRPYLILKWAVSADGFMDRKRGKGEIGSFRISNDASQRLLHKWRSEEGAVIIGSRTAKTDDPSLTVRHVSGRNPLRVVLSPSADLPSNLKMFSEGIPPVVYSNTKGEAGNAEWVVLKEEGNFLKQVLGDLVKRQVISVIVEGGRQTLQSFIGEGLWDEARVFRSNTDLQEGLRGPELNMEADSGEDLSGDRLLLYYNRA